MGIFHSVKGLILRNRDRLLKGLHNTITWNLEKIEKFVPGIEKEKMYCITANTSVGKSKLAKYMFTICPFEFYRRTGERVNILYYSLEESKEYFMLNILSYYLYIVYGIRRDPKEILSLTSPIDDDILRKIEELSGLLEQFESVVQIHTD